MSDFLDYGEVLKRIGAQLQEAGQLLGTNASDVSLAAHKEDQEARMLAEDAYNSLRDLFDSGVLP